MCFGALALGKARKSWLTTLVDDLIKYNSLFMKNVLIIAQRLQTILEIFEMKFQILREDYAFAS
jgi:hypothetical protein